MVNYNKFARMLTIRFFSLLLPLILMLPLAKATVKCEGDPSQVNQLTRLYDGGVSDDVPELNTDLESAQKLLHEGEVKTPPSQFLDGMMIFNPDRLFNNSVAASAIAAAPGKNVKVMASKGVVMHTSFAVTTEGLPIGILNQKIFAREPSDEDLKNKKKRSHNTNDLPAWDSS